MANESRFLVVNKTNFDQPWAAEFLSQLFSSDMHVMILPLGHDEGWASDAGAWKERFDEVSAYHYDLERPFRSYGMKSFRWIDYHDVSSAEVKSALAESELCVLVGTDPAACMERIEELDIRDALSSYHGILVLLSEAAHILEASFETSDDVTRDMHEGLGILPFVKFHMHYAETEEELRHMIRLLEADEKPVLVLSDQSGVYFEGRSFELLGDAFIAEDSDLDELYALL